MTSPEIPTLNFPSIRYGAYETAFDLTAFLYKGAAKENVRNVSDKIKQGKFGDLIADRLPLVAKIHQELNGKIVAGRSRNSLHIRIRALRYFFSWVDERGIDIGLDSLQETFLSWTDSEFDRVRNGRGMNELSTYMLAAGVGNTFGAILGSHVPLIALSNLRAPKKTKKVSSPKAEKQNLENSQEFANALSVICDAFSTKAVLWEDLPLRVKFPSGKELEFWSGSNRTFPLDILKTHVGIDRREPLINIRIESELFLFILQTGMNLSQAMGLKMCDFQYVSYLNGYRVRDRKERRGGDVIFEIFSEYRPHFERYLAWRREISSGSDFVFPFIKSRGGLQDSKVLAHRIRRICADLDIKFIPPRTIRRTRVNWLLRRSADPDRTAEMAQHTVETLLSQYELVSQQRAMSEVIQFWRENDPFLPKFESTSPGTCDGKPSAEESIPSTAPRPDCIRPSGCMWCEHHRDIDSFDYVWAMYSFRFLKTIELSRVLFPADGGAPLPAQLVVDRVTEKLHWFTESSEIRRDWVIEAGERISEENYHPRWASAIHRAETT